MFSPVTDSSPSLLSASPIFTPGTNCWRVAKAQRAALLVDGDAYFRRLDQVLRGARRSIMILGWDFDGHIHLRPEDPEPVPLGPFLRSLIEANEELEIRILVWSIAVLHAPGAPGELILGSKWQDHPRLHLRLDTFHPLYAAHHQKIVVVDDSVGFLGGIDLTVGRWDTPAHDIDTLAKRDPVDNSGEAVHDAQLIIDGEAAVALGEVARERWRCATREKLPPAAAPPADLWPADLVPDFAAPGIAIARSQPFCDDQVEVAEAALLTADVLAAAKRAIYIEAQYMTASFVGDVLARHLRDPGGPEIVVIMTHESRGLAERLVMSNNRDRLIRRLRREDLHGRFRAMYPVTTTSAGETRQILVHSKLVIVDDAILKIGSSNLNNRSISLDTECDAAIEASDAASAGAIAGLRARLLAEHLGISPADFAEAERTRGLIGAIEALNGGSRRLVPFEAMSDQGPARPVFGTALLDPKRPFRTSSALRKVARMLGLPIPSRRRGTRSRW